MKSDFLEQARKDSQKIERMIRHFYSHLPQRRVLVDGGAHHGYHSSYARRFFSNAVIAIEASPETYIEHIDRQRNLCSDERYCREIPLFGALGSRESQGAVVDFFFSPSHPGRSTVNPRMWEIWGKDVSYRAPISVPVLEIDDLRDYLAGSTPIDFIKLDLEGNEVKALRGARRTLAADRPAIVMEFGLGPDNEADYGETLDDFRNYLLEFKYRAIAPWGDDVTDSMLSGYPFSYVFLFTEESRKDLHRILGEAFRESLQES